MIIIIIIIILLVVVVIADVVATCFRDIERAGGSRPAYLFIYPFVLFIIRTLNTKRFFPHFCVFVSSGDLTPFFLFR